MNHPEEPRPEAGPIPRKRGEIGFVDGIHSQFEPRALPIAVTFPARHPADRDIDLEAQVPSANYIVPITPAPGRSFSREEDESDPASDPKNHNCPYRVVGLKLTTLSLCVLQFTLIIATAVGWAVAAHLIQSSSTTSSVGFGGSTLLVSIHVIFAIVLLVELVFLERTVFKLRIERYTYLNPGEAVPSSIRAAVPTPAIPFAPWNRPPLPTYAAALAQSGVGTGDVEDHMIAAPPPPAYGNTRGSRLVLAGYMRDSLTAQRPVSVASGLSYINQVPEGEPGPENYEQFVNGLLEGRVIHVGRDDADSIRDEADRENMRRRTLAVLENNSRPSSSHEAQDCQGL